MSGHNHYYFISFWSQAVASFQPAFFPFSLICIYLTSSTYNTLALASYSSCKASYSIVLTERIVSSHQVLRNSSESSCILFIYHSVFERAQMLTFFCWQILFLHVVYCINRPSVVACSLPESHKDQSVDTLLLYSMLRQVPWKILC